ncbi:MAG: T9SS type A sorting domain-containing protein [Chlorobi bacterium]|nr:T9SS type A sorting domain-containing protein [Chlorobiota bacterium]
MKIRNLYMLLIIALTITINSFAQTTVPIYDIRENDANGVPVNMDSVYTVAGIVTSSNQFGNSGPASMQDSTAGISIYSSEFANGVNIGDSVVITSSITQYRGLTQFSYGTGSSFTVLSSGNAVDTIIVTLNDIANQAWDGVEIYESRLVRVNSVTISGSGYFEGNKNYSITDTSGSLELRVDIDVSSLVGSPIPSGEVDLIGVVGQYKYSAPYNSGYQILPRSIDDIISDDVPVILTPVIGTDITTSSFTVYFNTARNGNSEVRYGKTDSLELGSVVVDTDTTGHIVEITGLEEFTKYYYKAYSTNAVGTSESTLKTIVTLSSNPVTGTINVYFNSDVDHSVAIPGNEAEGNVDFQEKIISRINQANYSIDLALYSFFGLPNVEAAIIAAKNRGVKVRFVYDQRTIQSGAQALLDAGILMSQRPDDNGLMHSKFAIFDGRDNDLTNDWVWMGSWNWTSTELVWLNNVVEINDPALAQNYTIEFEEMWGSDTDTPDPNNVKFGPNKIDNTVHTFTIGGIEIESYFSPSDQTESHISNSLSTADTSIYFALLAFTSDPLFATIESQHNNGMDDGRGIIADANLTGSEFANLQNLFPGEVFDQSSGDKLHNKFGLVDAAYSTSDPMVITGSHNWSKAANTRNDENTLIFHDIYIANQYMQAFKSMYNFNGGTTDFDIPVIVSVDNKETIPVEFELKQNYPNPFNPSTTIRYSIPAVGKGHAASVRLIIYDILGREVATLVNKEQSPGNYSVQFDASGLSSGLYVYRLTSGSYSKSLKLMLMK